MYVIKTVVNGWKVVLKYCSVWDDKNNDELRKDQL